MKHRDPKTGRWAGNPVNVLRPTVKVFVFGTLKRGYSNHVVLGGEHRLVGEAETTSCYRMYSAGFPVILADGDGHRVTGELYEVPPKQLIHLDRLEGEGRMYDRKVEEVTLKSGSPIPCYIYVGCDRYWDRQFSGREPMPLNENGLHEWPEPPTSPFIDTDFGQVEQRIMSALAEGRLDDSDHFIREDEFVEPEDQDPGDVEGYHDEREQP